MKNMIRYDIDDVLDLVGLRRSRSLFGIALSAIGLVAVGAAVGACAGLMLAPSSGRRLRQDVGDRLGQLRRKIKSDARKLAATNATPAAQP